MKKDIDIHELMLTKDFKALNTKEQAAVLAEMTEEAYAEQRTVLLTFGTLTAEETLPGPDAAILASLRAKHDALHQQTNTLDKLLAILTQPIPAYQLIIVPAVLVIAFLFFWPNQPTESRQVVIESSFIKDTIEVMREVPQTMKRVVYEDRLAAASVLPEGTDDKIATQAATAQLPDDAALKRSRGNSGLDVSILERLEAVAYREGI